MSDPFEPLTAIADKISRDGESAVTVSELQYFAITWFVIEVQNGGLHQFFSNDAGRYAHEALDGLRRIGAVQSAGVLDRAIAVFPGRQVPKDRGERNDALDSLGEEIEWAFLDSLTTEYLSSREPVADLFESFAAAHRDEYPTIKTA